MASQGQMTGMLGVYLTAAELIKNGFIVSPTSRSARGADLLVTDQLCRNAWSVQVKTKASNANFWLVGAHTKEMTSRTHVYVFVTVLAKQEKVQFYVVPSRTVATAVRTFRRKRSTWYSFPRKERYLDNWKVFGNPMGAVPAKRARKAKV
jgi:hypothetical protein